MDVPDYCKECKTTITADYCVLCGHNLCEECRPNPSKAVCAECVQVVSSVKAANLAKAVPQ